uniref:BED-type domain-containing protein n=1 Tax=Trichuris muris TaxID=70415 RepID=A0A5S6QPE4_TRIMR
MFFEFWSITLCAVLLIPSSVMSDSKLKKIQYSSEYLSFGFTCYPTNRSLPMCVLCERVLSNGAMNPSRLKEHLTKVHPERSRENVAYFRKLRDKIMNRRTLRSNFTDDCKVWQTTYNRGAVVGSSGQRAKTLSRGELMRWPWTYDGALRHSSAAFSSEAFESSFERVFAQLCDEKDEEYNRLLLHTEVRWLSRDEDVALRDMLALRQADIAYLADLYGKFNAMNLQLQLALYKRNISRGELCQFPKLAELKRCPDPCDQDIEVYSEHLEMLHEELKRRFHDVLSMVVPNWEELVELQSNDELKPRLRQGYAAFWLQKQIPVLYPRLCVVTDLLTKKRNRLQVVNRGNLRLRVTGIEPDIEKLARLHGRHHTS